MAAATASATAKEAERAQGRGPPAQGHAPAGHPGEQVANTRATPDRRRHHECRESLEANGWTETRGGKHGVKMTKPGYRPITLHHDKGGGGYPPGLTAAILRQAGLKGDDHDE